MRHNSIGLVTRRSNTGVVVSASATNTEPICPVTTSEHRSERLLVDVRQGVHRVPTPVPGYQLAQQAPRNPEMPAQRTGRRETAQYPSASGRRSSARRSAGPHGHWVPVGSTVCQDLSLLHQASLWPGPHRPETKVPGFDAFRVYRRPRLRPNVARVTRTGRRCESCRPRLS